MNKLFNIPKMKIVVISAAIIVVLSITTVAVVCMNLEAIGRDDESVADAMAQVSESESDALTETLPPETETELPRDDESGLLYQNNGNGTCTVVGIGTCKKTEIYLPEKSPEGLKVVAISTGAFENCSKLESKNSRGGQKCRINSRNRKDTRRLG